MLSPKPYIRDLEPTPHGGRLYSELNALGIDPQTVLDFSVSTNPFGPPEGLKEAIRAADLESYPDSDSNLLKIRLAEKLEIKTANLIVGNGSTELIRLAATAYLGPGDRAMILQPTYGEYAAAAKMTGAGVIRFQLSESRAFSLDPDLFIQTLEQMKPQVLFLCNPNNPTGEYLTGETVRRLIESDPARLVVLDEAYLAFLEKPWDSTALTAFPNVLVIRSMTKDYAMAGVRLGYAMADSTLIDNLNKVKPPWNVSAMAQNAGLFVLQKAGYLEQMRAELAAAGRYLKDSLRNLGLPPLPSRTNFFLVKTGSAGEVRKALLKKKILVRDCTSFGLPQYIRLACRSRVDCECLIAALIETGVRNYDG